MISSRSFSFRFAELFPENLRKFEVKKCGALSRAVCFNRFVEVRKVDAGLTTFLLLTHTHAHKISQKTGIAAYNPDNRMLGLSAKAKNWV